MMIMEVPLLNQTAFPENAITAPNALQPMITTTTNVNIDQTSILVPEIERFLGSS
jgi:hypothetical protein